MTNDYIKQLENRVEQTQARITECETIFDSFKRNFEVEVAYTRRKNNKIIDYVEVDVFISPKNHLRKMISSVGYMQLCKKKNEWAFSFNNSTEPWKKIIKESSPEEYAKILIEELGFEHIPYTIKEKE